MATQSGNEGWIGSGVLQEYGTNAVTVTKSVTQRRPVDRATAFDTVVSVEFVAKPSHAAKVQDSVPAAITSTFESIAAFGGCAVMVSDQEQRLVTVLTFWRGDHASSAGAENVRWVCKLLDPYMDRKLRVQTMRSHLAVSPATAAAQREDRRIRAA